jgi:HSP20 family protein
VSMFDPFADLTRLRQQIGQMLDEAQPSQTAARAEAGRVWRPPVDVFEDPDQVTLKVDLPGVDRESLDVQLQGEELTITGHRKWAAPEKGGCVHAERPHGQFHRVFRLGLALQHDAVQASYRDGVLTVVLPKAEAVKPRRISVRAEGEG